MLTDLQKLLAHAVLLNGTAYCTLTFLAGMHTGNPTAWKASIVTVGLCWVCYAGEYLSGISVHFAKAAMVGAGLSIVTGLIAGAALLLGS